jgi:drug/metabolite transporter (DMT)-like permease
VLVLGLVAALVAAAANAGAAMLEAMATRRATRPAGVVTSPLYLGGLLLDIAGWVLTVLALRYMPIVAVQAIVAGQVAITVVASHWVFDTPLRRIDLAAAAANVVGLALLVGSAETDELPRAGVGGTIALIAVLVVLAVVGIVTALKSRRSVPLAFLAGLAFGGTAVAVRLVDLDGPVGEVAHTVLTDPVAWALLGYAALGLGLYTVALARGAVGPVVAVLAVTETLVPGLLGLAVLGDGIRGGWTVGFLAGLVLALGGVVVLARSPAQASLAGDDGVARPPLKRV